MNKNNKKGRPTLDATARRNKSLTIRLNDKEREVIAAKCAEAGYQAAGAFIRDFLINSETPHKTRIPLHHKQLSLDLQRIASLVIRDIDSEQVVQELFALSNMVLGFGD